MSASILDRYAERVSRPYVEFLHRLQIHFDIRRAEGAVLEDASGRSYVDCVGGYGNLNIGHNHPRLIEAMTTALQSHQPFGWPFISEAHVELADKLIEALPGGLDRCLIVNSGAEAVDSALKLARLATGRPEVICCLGGWHGFTLGAMSASEPKMCRNFQPLLPGMHHVPFGDAPKVKELLSDKVGAVLVEPLQSESGGIVPPEGYLRELAAACESVGALFIVDEVKSGMGKTGKLLACEFEGVVPDVVLVGKSLGGGVMPIGAMVAKKKWWTRFGLTFAMTSSSAAGNSFACAAGVATLNVIRTEKLSENAEKQGARLQEHLRKLCARYPEVLRDVTGRGLLLGLHTANQKTASEIIVHCLGSGVFLMPALLAQSSILIEPPLCIKEEQVSRVLYAIENACEALAGEAQ
jgi:putrescine aminotransferase